MNICNCAPLLLASRWLLLRSDALSGKYLKSPCSGGKYKKTTALFLLLSTFQSNAASFTEASATGSQAEAIAACEARAASFGAAGCADPGTSYKAGYVYGGSWCDKYETYNGRKVCVGDTYLSFFYFPVYKIGTAYYRNQNSCTVGNPIDPVTGSKKQKESLVSLDATQPLVLNLFYDSSSLNKWSHTYSRRLVFSDVSTGSRFDLNNYGSANGFNPIVQPEQPSSLGGAIGVFGKKNTAPVDSGQIYLTKEEACTTGWGSYRNKFNYSWVSGSVAEYRSIAISTFGAIDKCYILDAPDGNVKMVLDIYELFSGKPSGGGLASPPGPDNAGGYMRFVRETNEAIVFRNFDNYANVHGTGETVEKITVGAVTTFRLHTADDTTEEYSSDGKLISITSAQGYVQTITYIPGTDLILRVSNQTGESLVFSYESYGDTNQYTRIKTVASHDDRSWNFNYDGTNHTLVSIDLPDGKQRQFHYEDTGNAQLLTGITDETGTRYATWAYDVEERANLSAHGVAEEKDRVEILYADNLSRGTRFVTTVRKSALTESINDIKSVYYTHSGGGSPIVAEITGNNPIKFEYDAMTGYLEYVEDKGRRTEYSLYDNKGNPGKIVEAAGTPEQRQTIYTYDSRYHSKIASITEASVYPGNSKVTTNQYDDFGNNTAVTINGFRPDGTAVSRTTTFEYNGPFHQLTQIDGPRTDVSDIYTIDYYPDDVAQGDDRARMRRVAAPLNIVLYDDITYTPTGKIKTYVDANSVQATLSYYYGNDRLQSLSQLDMNTGGTRLTEWTYLATGEVKTITSGADVTDKTTLTFNYDDARRLTSIVDGLGNAIEYVLDSEGNVEQETIRDAIGILNKQLTQTFDDYNRLQLRTQANEQFTEIWSPDGTLDKTVDGKSVTTDYSYDNLRRLTQINQDMGGNSPQTADALTILNYDVQDNLTTVTDANGGQTSYVYDDLGNLLSETSPDTGTRTYTHDAAGNVISLLDAKSQSFVYAYDALNRLVNVDAPGTDDDITNIYDVCNHGNGLLCRSQRNIVTLSYRYNAFGDMSTIEQIINTWPGYNQAVNNMGYDYDTAGRLKNISYPSGAVITYDYDAAGNINTVSLTKDGIDTVLSQNIRYQPFGENGSQGYGNGLSVLDYKDVAYRPLITGTPMLYFDYFSSYDANGNPTDGITLDSGLYLTQNYSFDEHDRLDISSGLFGDFDYDYDKVGNRTRLLQDGAVTDSSYQPQTNLMAKHANETILMDANGNTLNLHGMALSYTADNRLKSLGVNASYYYNGLGQRVAKKIKSGAVATTRTYLYGQSGELLAEIGPKGDVFREYIYLNGKPLALLEHVPDSNENFLVADIDGDGNISIEDYILWYVNYYMTGDISKDVNGDGALDNLDASILVNCALATDSCRAASYNTAIYYIHNDHLGTPKVLTNEAGKPVWRALADPFGKATVDEDVDGDGRNVVMNFRFPGQYYDAESGLHYNYFRYYDPSLGRYITSDPIGLFGGVNTFGYVEGNPLINIDFFGLLTFFDGFSDSFLNQFKSDAPNEYKFFEQYAKNINVDNWTDDIRNTERAWRLFDPYARGRARSEVGRGCLDASSVNDFTGVLSSGLNGLAGLALSSSSSLNSVINNASFISNSSELINIMTYGPSVINQSTWTQAFPPYTGNLTK